ncbi:MAG: trigger factor [Oscillospiraceae bacterium]|nr:trigger factor [Oscillospiraceae bacterium]
MITTVEQLGGNKVKIHFEADAETFESCVQAAYLKNRGRVQVPGFRRGKAPRRMIENMYGESIFYDDALQAVFPDAYEAAVAEHKLDVVDRPVWDVEQMGGGQPLLFTAEVYVRPEVKLGAYKGLHVHRHAHPVTSADVDAKLAEAREKVSRLVDVEDRPAATGDIVALDYAGTVDGTAFPGGTAQGSSITIGSGQFIPGFEEQLVGLQAGEEKDISVTFPKDYHAEDLAGKDAMFHIKINGIQFKELPEMDDDFARDVSEFDTLDAYKADIRAKLEADAAAHTAQHFENDAVQAAVDNAQVDDIPESMISRQTDSLVRDFEMRLAYQGLRLEDFIKYSGQSEQDMRERYREEAARQVKTQLTLDAIRKAEGIEPTEDDVEQALTKYAEQAQKSLDEFKATLQDDDLEYIRSSLATEQTVALITGSAIPEEEDHDDHDDDHGAPGPKPKRARAAKKEA